LEGVNHVDQIFEGTCSGQKDVYHQSYQEEAFETVVNLVSSLFEVFNQWVVGHLSSDGRMYFVRQRIDRQIFRKWCVKDVRV
jgi:hypothetical protein